jgi:hypothetical protein
VNFFHTRASAVTTGLVAAALVTATLTGCGAGQQSQTATQEPAVNGASGGTPSIALRDVRIRADQGADAVQPGQSVALMFVAANKSTVESDRLVRITSDVGQVSIDPPNVEIPAGQALIVGKPDGADAEELQAASSASKATATVKLSKSISNGLTYAFVFTFERAGAATVSVPLSAGENSPRKATAEVESEDSH